MFTQVLAGATISSLCIIVQSAMVVMMVRRVRPARMAVRSDRAFVRAFVIVGLASLWLMLVHGVAIVAWAAAYSALGVFSDIDTAVYFSAVAFTTLGFGDIIPPVEWRQLAGICAAHGLLVFGVSSAALVEIFRRIVDDGHSS